MLLSPLVWLSPYLSQQGGQDGMKQKLAHGSGNAIVTIGLAEPISLAAGGARRDPRRRGDAAAQALAAEVGSPMNSSTPLKSLLNCKDRIEILSELADERYCRWRGGGRRRRVRARGGGAGGT
jgi:hypothetical protein